MEDLVRDLGNFNVYNPSYASNFDKYEKLNATQALNYKDTSSRNETGQNLLKRPNKLLFRALITPKDNGRPFWKRNRIYQSTQCKSIN